MYLSCNTLIVCIHDWMHLIFIGTARSSNLELCVWSHQCLLTKLLCLTAVQRTGGVWAGRKIPSKAVSCLYIYSNITVNYLLKQSNYALITWLYTGRGHNMWPDLWKLMQIAHCVKSDSHCQTLVIPVATNNLGYSITAKSSLNCLTEAFFQGMSISQNYLDGPLMHMLAQDKQSTSCKLPDNKLVMLVINWAIFCGIWSLYRSCLKPFNEVKLWIKPLHMILWLPTTLNLSLYTSACGIPKSEDNSPT